MTDRSRLEVPRSRLLISLTAQFVVILAVFYFYFAQPVSYVRLIAEDNWGEYSTFVAFMIASYLFAAQFFLSDLKKQNVWYLLLAVGAFLVAMEEISWGQRILSITTPEFLEQVNFQGEIGLHNIRAISPDNLTYQVIGTGFVVYGLILPVLVIYLKPVRSLVQRLNVPLPSLHLSPLFVATAYFLYFNQLVSPLAKSDEVGELFMGISLVVLSVDTASRTLRYRANSFLAVKLFGTLIMLLIVWIGFAQIVVPSLIEAAYMGKSLPFFNEMISGQASQALTVYQGGWLQASWLFTGLIACIGGLTVVLVPNLPRLVGVEAPEILKNIATPVVAIVALALGLLLAITVGSSHQLDQRLIQFVRTSLPELGHVRQAEAILPYLEGRSSLTNRELLVTRGLVATNMGHKVEAQAIFEKALELLVEQNDAHPYDPIVFQEIATIYSYMGDVSSARKYFNMTLEIYEKNFQDSVSNEQKTRQHLSRAEIYEALGEYDAAINAYLDASKIAPDAYSRNNIEYGLGRVFSVCNSGKLKNSRVPWEKIEAMGREQGSRAQWCARTGGNALLSNL